MLHLACTTISSVDLAQYGVSLAKDRISVDCGTNKVYKMYMLRAALLIMAFLSKRAYVLLFNTKLNE